MNLISTLESGRREFLKAALDLTPEQAASRSRSGGWSVLECIEHVVIVEDRYLAWLTDSLETAPERNTEREIRLFSMIRNRDKKVEAPDAARPQGRFDNLDAALAAFNAARDLSVRFVEERGDALYSIGAKHPFFGILNGAELVQLMDGHASRHAGQIRDILEAIG